MDEELIGVDILKERKKKILIFLKEKKNWIYYLILSLIVFVGVYIRTRNLSKLKDITTGTWTLGPDLDPFLFLRWAKEIVENGSLMVLDTMRYVPIGFDTAFEMKLLSYMIAWFYQFLSFFSNEVTVTYAAVIFPAFMFGLTTIAFFLFSRKIFYKESEKVRNLIALIATSFFILIPSLLPRTIAGIPEKESAAFFFMFLAFYFFLEAFSREKLRTRMIFGILSGFATAAMGLIWGGVLFIFFTIPTAILLAFILGKIKKHEYIIYSSWLITSFLVMMPFSARYNLKNLIVSTSTGWAIGVLLLLGISLLIMHFEKINKLKNKIKLPKEISSLIIAVLILFLVILITLGPNFVFDQIIGIKNSLISPQTSRFGLTVAENKQPYFINDWKNSFGPVFRNIPLFFWLFFIGSVYLFNNLIKSLGKKERIILTLSYFIFLISLIFSRYSSGSILNGTSGLSLLIYFLGWIFLLGSFGYFYYKTYKEGNFEVFRVFSFEYILYFIILTLGIIGARAGIRLIMFLGAVSPVVIGFLIVKSTQKYLSEKDDMSKLFTGIFLFIIIISSLFTMWTYYQSDRITAENFAPGPYQWQWQNAMSWVRENTPENAVFAHWWDYGYWLQSIGERATILDGGNAINYWNYLMGRYVLTGDDEQKALEFLYTHEGTHLLIDSTEIGKYTAYSSIGSDENYDRLSWIPTFLMDDSQTQITPNETIYVYSGGSALDEDIIIKENGRETLLPKNQAGIGAIILRTNPEGEVLQPEIIVVYNGRRYNEKIRFAYFNNQLIDFGSGMDVGIFTFPRINTLQDGQLNVNEIGASFYLSGKTIHSQLANLYLFNQPSEGFRLVHTESNLFVENLRQQGLNIGEFVFFQGFQGPIKIWEINYSGDEKINPEYLLKRFPENIEQRNLI